MDTSDETYKAPYLQEEDELEQITIDAWWYEELKKAHDKIKIVKEYFALKNSPLELTSDEKQQLINLEKKLKL